MTISTSEAVSPPLGSPPTDVPFTRIPPMRPARATASFLRRFALALICSIACLATSASAQVRMSQIWTNNSSSGTTSNAAFVELLNAGGASVDLSTFSLHFASATGTTWTRLGLTGTIPARSYYLARLVNPSSSSTANPLPLPDSVSATITLGTTSGKLGLIQGSSTAAATGQCCVPPAGSTLVDFVGYGTTADAREAGGAPCSPAGTTANNAPAPTTALGLFRIGCGATDTNFNNTDWVTGAPNPRNSGATSNGLSGAGSNTTVATGATPTITFTASVCAGGTVSAGATATIDLTQIGGSAAQAMTGPVGNVFTLNTFAIPAATNAALYTLPVTVTDGASSGRGLVVLNVTATVAPANNVAGANIAAFTIPSSGGDATATVINSTKDGTDDSTCGGGTGGDVYHYFTPAATGNWSIDVCRSAVNWDTELSIHTGFPCTIANQVLPISSSCADGGCPGGTLNTSAITVPLTAGTFYVIRVQGWSSTASSWKSYRLHVQGNAPANDNCANAIALTLGGAPISGTTILSNTDGTSTCDIGGRDVWYKITTPSLGDISVNTCASAIDTVISLYASCGGAAIACNDDCGGAPCGGTSSCLTATSQPAGTYLIRVSDKGIGSGGSFNVSASFVGPTPPSVTATATPNSVMQGGTTTLTATVTPGTNPTSTGITVAADLTQIGGGSSVLLFDDGIPPDVTANDNIFTRTVTVGAVSDGTKSIPITANDAQARSGNTSVSLNVGYCAPTVTTPCGGNEFISNVTIGSINNSSACLNGYESFIGQSTAVNQGGTATIFATVGSWFSSTDTVTVFADWNQNGVLDNAGETTLLTDPGSHVYTGVINVPFGATLGSTRLRVRLNFGANPGPCGNTSFGNIEDYTLVVGPPGPPTNDTCASALAATCGGSVTGDTSFATVDSVPVCGPAPTAPGVWYTITGTGFAMSATTCDPATTFDTRLTVFDGSGGCGSLICVGDNDDDGVCASPDRSTVSWASTLGTTYYLLVHGHNAATGVFKLSLTCPDYCASVPTDTTFEFIRRVEFGTIDNSPAGTPHGHYTLYALSTPVAQCGSYPIRVTITDAFTVDRCTVYVDWNQNLVLNDAGEMYQLNGGLGPNDINGVPLTSSGSDGYFTGVITVPFGASLGNARIRVAMGDSSVNFLPTNPCGTFTYGEVEDYGATVSAGGTTFYADVDGDGFGNAFGATVLACSAPAGYAANATDCNDNDASVHPGAPEVCDGIDNNCDSQIDEGVKSTFYADVDGDGFGDPNDTVLACSAPPGYVADNTDGCPTDGGKQAPGQCGCGTPDTDTDGDGVANCNDGCPTDATKTTPGVCGCGTPDLDSDGDGTFDCLDGCPLDAFKLAPGICGCGVSDVDSDGDGTADCNDGCPTDSAKIAPGACGCGVADTDSDLDGTPDCHDGCPNDPAKIARGICGCGVSDADSDGDGTADCLDGCPSDAGKIAPGQCGCGVRDTDSDGDGVANCNDGCPTDSQKTSPGVCGCGLSDADLDGDGQPDCNDLCPGDPLKSSPGICGCGVPDTDSDGDGTADCLDGCPSDPSKIAPGQCGCGVADIDTDGDGTANCNDGCPNDANKIAPGQCGCGNLETDTDGDGVADCVDNCVNLANPGQEDCNGNSIGDACDIAAHFSLDTNADGIPDECQAGVGTPFCFGDGSGTPCPCGNNDGAGAGCKNSSGFGALIYNLGGASVGAGDTALYVVRLPTNKFGLVFLGTSPVAGGNGAPFMDGLRCVAGFTHRFSVHNSGSTGSFAVLNPAAQAPSIITAGAVLNFQAWTRDPAGPCGLTANFSNAVRITFTP